MWASPDWWLGEEPGTGRLEEPCFLPPPGGTDTEAVVRAVASPGQAQSDPPLAVSS